MNNNYIVFLKLSDILDSAEINTILLKYWFMIVTDSLRNLVIIHTKHKSQALNVNPEVNKQLLKLTYINCHEQEIE